MTNSKFHINAQNVQIVETTAGGDAVIHKYTNDSQVTTALNTLLEFIKEQQEKHPDTQPEQAEDILNAEIVHIQKTQPQRWQQLKQQFRNLPKDLRNPERLMQASKSALVQVTTDLTDNIFLNAVVAFLDGLSGEPD